MSGTKYRPEIDGLRAVAVLPVILFHAGVGVFSGGFIGVDVFFVISGFLITSILLNDIHNGTYSLWQFYERRARRILPALLFVILVTLPFAWLILLPPDFADFGYSVIATMTFLSNVYFFNEINYFNPSAEYMPLLHTWSLAVEEQFYILFPPLLYILIRRFASFTTSVLVFLFGVSLVFAQYASAEMPTAAFFLLPARIWELLLGSLAAVFVHKHGLPSANTMVKNTVGLAGLGMIVGSIFLLDKHVPFPGIYAVPATLGTALIILFAQPGTLTHLVLSNRPFVAVGLISYSAYLWHQPLIALQRYRFPDWEFGPLAMAALTLPIAWLSWRYVERPFRTKQLLPTRQRCLAVSGMSLVAFSVVGFVASLQNGWESRFPSNEQRVFQSFVSGPEYVPARFNALVGEEFPNASDKKKVLIVGDSYGQDLVNAIHEAGYGDAFYFSTHHIAGRCGNLMIADLAEFRDPAHRVGCRKSKGYDDPQLRERMSEADEIWLVSSWVSWSAELLERSVENIEAVTSADIIVFGRKHLGIRTLRDYYPHGLDGLLGKQDAPAHLGEVQEWMAANIPSFVQYVDIQDILCGDQLTCSNADGNGNAISFDGTHLTPEGALLLGTKLRPHLL